MCGMTATRIAKIAVVAALLTVLIVLLIAAATGHRCFLDLLNAAIAKQCTFQPFYAGTANTPPVREVIPEFAELEDSFDLVLKEMNGVMSDRAQIPLMHETYDHIFMYKTGGGPIAKAFATLVYGPDTEIFDNIGSPDWQTFNLILFGRDVPGNAARCPQTVKLLRRVPGMQSALFSIIAPGAYIPPHSDPAKGVIRYHLALQVPRDRERCFINVDGQNYHWAEGKSVLFDDVFDHWVLNDTDEYRVILFVDILRPLTGFAKLLQGCANFANRYHPGVRRAIRASEVTSTSSSI
jgi:hypothetical protein